jgi:Co/Zn/Cd efflux system component
LGNLAVLLAALGGFGTGTGWPDVIVAAIMAALALQGATTEYYINLNKAIKRSSRFIKIRPWCAQITWCSP